MLGRILILGVLVGCSAGISCGGLRRGGSLPALAPDAAVDGSIAVEAGEDNRPADSSARDASDVDTNRPTCQAGLSCNATNPCHEGEIACAVGGAMSCSDTSRSKPDGTDCGASSVCLSGACVTCAAGQDCPLTGKPCRIGKLVCSTGVAVCTESDNQADGIGCGTNMVCQAGACVACAAGQACTPSNPCHKGSVTCMGGVVGCSDTAINLSPGTSCGKDLVCSATAACVACVNGSSCTIAGNPCRTGTTTCNTGAPVCLESGNATDGTTCATGVCSGGACVACTAGLSCVPANPCHAGKTACSPISCTDTTTVVQDGTSCGTDKVCSAGTCVTCAAGKSCTLTDPCKVGTTSCSTGVSTCLSSGNSPNGTSCGSGKVCSAGICVACSAGAACPPTNPCHQGTLVCSTGAAVCTDTNVALADGTAGVCGTNLVCRSGMCVSCTPNVACQPSNPCKTGATSCATGTSVCVENGDKPAGTNCSPAGSSGMVCNAGACVACAEGGDCKPTNACHQGKLSCATGVARCVDNNVVLANGTACGPTASSNLFCSAGVCSSCTPNLTCTTNPTSCKAGVTSCTTGVSQCVDGSNKPTGSACGSSASSACSAADSCDGAGACSPNNMPSGTNCGICHQCNGSGSCINGYEGTQDTTGGCNAAATACSNIDTCVQGVCQPNNKQPGLDCGVCMQCNATGGCVPGYLGGIDSTGCNAPAMCTPNGSSGTKTAAQACNSAGQCVAATTTCPTGCAGTDCALPRCGDGVKNQATELCDDGNTSNLDSCSLTCTTCGMAAGPASFDMIDDGDSELGMTFTATANTTIYQFTYHNNGRNTTLLLRQKVTGMPVDSWPVLQRLVAPPVFTADMSGFVPQNVVYNVVWPLEAGKIYTLSDQFVGNARFTAVPATTYPNTQASGIQIISGWEHGNLDLGFPDEISFPTFWFSYTNIHACLN